MSGQSPFPPYIISYHWLLRWRQSLLPSEFISLRTDFLVITSILTFFSFRCRNSREGRLSPMLKVNLLFSSFNNPLGLTLNA